MFAGRYDSQPMAGLCVVSINRLVDPPASYSDGLHRANSPVRFIFLLWLVAGEVDRGVVVTVMNSTTEGACPYLAAAWITYLTTRLYNAFGV